MGAQKKVFRWEGGTPMFADTLFHLTEAAAADFTRELAPLVMEALHK
ncbi:MAG: hypothetical protein ACI9NQ_001131 [Paracoccaceae bacterium]|jgi:hypothetical protein